MEALKEQSLCERCGHPYGCDAVNDCHPGDCMDCPLPSLRPGRDEFGRYFPAGHAAELRAKATYHREQAIALEREADQIAKLGSIMLLPEVTPE